MNATTGKRSLTRSFLLAGTIALGFGTLWFVVTTWTGTTVLEARQGGRRPPFEQVVVAADGTPLVQVYSYDDQDRVTVTYRESDGRGREIPDQKDLAASIGIGGEIDEDGTTGMQRGWDARIRPFQAENAPELVWYFVHDGKADGSGEFIGYDRRTNREIGRLGLAGFREGPLPSAERIPVRGELALNFASWSSSPIGIYSPGPWPARPMPLDVPPRLVFVPSGNELRVADLAARTITTLFRAPEPIASVGVPRLWNYSGSGKETRSEQPILVSAGRIVYKLDRAGKVTGTFHVPAEIDRRSNMNWYELDDGRAVVECHEPPDVADESPIEARQAIFYQLAADGSILEKSQLTTRYRAGMWRTRRTEAAYAAAVVPAPVMLLAIGAFVAAMTKPWQSLPMAFWDMLSANWAAWVLVLAIVAALACVVWWWSRRIGLSPRERIAWIVFVLLLGIPGFVGFLLHRRWPARVSCPSCGERPACDHDACTSCNTPFPAPALKGTEIFA